MIITLMIAAIAMCFLVAMMTYHSNANWFFKLTALPTSIFVVVFSIMILLEQRGKALEELPPNDFYRVHHINIEENEIAFTYIWAYTENTGHKLYKIPYNRDTAKQLEEMEKQQQAGHEVTGKFVTDKDTTQKELTVEHIQSELENENELKNYEEDSASPD